MIEILVYPADEVEKEIGGLMDNFKEMELQKDEQIEQLKKEKEWLINQLAYVRRKDGELIIEEMQQAL